MNLPLRDSEILPILPITQEFEFLKVRDVWLATYHSISMLIQIVIRIQEFLTEFLTNAG